MSRIALLTIALAGLLVPAAAAQSRYFIDSDAGELTYAMDHPAHHWTATSHAATGLVGFNAAMKPTEITVKASVMSFDSGNRNRDSHTAEVVESYIFRDVSFHGTEIQVGEPDSTGRTPWEIDGELTFHGVTQPQHVTAFVTRSQDSLVATGSFETTLTAFDIDLPSFLFVKAKDWLKLDFDLHAIADQPK